MSQILVGDISVDVHVKGIKNLYLGVLPPAGSVRISAPKRMSMVAIRKFAISKLGWIKRQQERLRRLERETAREYINGESHYVWRER